MTYLVMLELADKNETIKTFLLFEKIKQSKNWAKLGSNVWLIKPTLTTDVLMADYRQVLGASDKLLIIEVTNAWISLHFSTEVVEWMKSGL